MMSSLYIGATGMKSLSQGMGVITNNLANVSTIGYKQQDVQYADLIYKSEGNTGNSWNAEDQSYVALDQVGMGVKVSDVRTIFTQGSFQAGSSVTDMALNGDGFFQVQTPDDEIMYSRAGNFYFNENSELVLPDGSNLMGYSYDLEGNKGALETIQVDQFDVMPPKATTEVNLGFNLGKIEDNSASTTDPYFTLAKSFDGTSTPPLSEEQYSYTQPIRIYDAEGNAHDLSLYVDGAPSADPDSVMEFVIASKASEDNPAGQALLSGTMTFDSAGNLIGINYFSPTAEDTSDLNNWAPAATNESGQALMNVNGQSIALDFGLTGDMQGVAATAAAVGTDRTNLGYTANATLSGNATTAFSGSNSMHLNEQDGYIQGYISNINITANGEILGSYTNGEDAVLYEIPIARFTSEDGLRREGGNLFSATPESGPAELGRAGTENYATVISNYTENSNVDMAAEMVDMIITQRGFQSNSKVVTTADAMLQKAMELKRN